MNYTMQSFNFRGREEYRPFYDLIANIAAEELSHVELVSYTINLLLNGATERNPDPTSTPLKASADARNYYHFVASGQQAVPFDSMGNPWNGTYVFSSGNLKLDLLHNFFLECGARANKIRVYETVDDPAARAMLGYLLVRGGTHVVAYARALEVLTGADLSKLFPIPDISNKKFPEAALLEERGLHLKMFRFSPSDYTQMAHVWKGPHPESGEPLEVVDDIPEGFPPPVLPAEPQLTSPDGLDPEMMAEMAKRLFG
jgi:Mn-containing catalase